MTGRLKGMIRALQLFALIGSATAANAAGFVNTGEAWLRLPPEARMAYVQGLNDGANFIFINDDLATAIVKLSRTRCLSDQGTTAAVLADRITTAYTNEAALFANRSPMIVYITKMGEYCRDIINQERGRYGLPPQ